MSDQRYEERFKRDVLCHLNVAYNLARWLVKNADDAEDVVQESMVRAYRSFPKLQSENAKPWLLAIVRNVAMTHMKKESRGKLVDLELEDVTDENINHLPEVVLNRTLDRDAIYTALNSLSIASRELLILRELEGLSYAEISEVTGRPIGTVMSGLARARTKVFAKLSEETS